MTAAPALSQDVATPPAEEMQAGDTMPADAAPPLADTAPPLADVPPEVQQQAGQAATRPRMSFAEKAAAVTGAVAAGVIAFKGLSALFKSKKQAEPAPVAQPAN